MVTEYAYCVSMSVRMGLLALLEAGPSHGYHLKAAFEARTGGVWTVNVGQVYTTLDRLHADGLVEPVEIHDVAADGRDRRPWRMTSSGKAALDAWFDDAAVDPAPRRDELLVKVLLAFGRSSHEALSVIDRQRSELYRVAQSERRKRPGAVPGAEEPDQGEPGRATDLAAYLMAEAVSSRREADLRWLDHCESVILTQRSERAQP